MAVPTSYLTGTKNVDAIVQAMQRAEVPSKFSHEFLKQLGFTSSADRPIIPLLKEMGFLDQAANPTDRYRRFKNPSDSKAVFAEGMREAYADVFAIDPKAYSASNAEVRGIFARLSGKGERVVDQMALTFKALARNGDFAASKSGTPPPPPNGDEGDSGDGGDDLGDAGEGRGKNGFNLHHDIHVHLPESTSIEVYDAIFRALRQNFAS